MGQRDGGHIGVRQLERSISEQLHCLVFGLGAGKFGDDFVHCPKHGFSSLCPSEEHGVGDDHAGGGRQAGHRAVRRGR